MIYGATICTSTILLFPLKINVYDSISIHLTTYLFESACIGQKKYTIYLDFRINK